MSPKQEIYQDMLRWALPHLRNLSSGNWWQRLRYKSAYHDSELVHNLPVSMYDEEFVDHDIWFLNVQAWIYYEKCNSDITPLYDRQIENISRLFDLVPASLKSKLKWNGPNSTGHLAEHTKRP